MCLDLKEGAELQIATENIIVYKRIVAAHSIFNPKSGQSFKSVIKGIGCEGKISVEDNRIYFCTDDKRLNDSWCNDTQGYKYCWWFDHWVDLSKTTIDDKSIPIIKYTTPYRRKTIKIGEIYHSELKRCGNRVNKGLHSFASTEDAACDGGGSVVECIIPKGSQYYIGTFGSYISYASDCIQYVKII